MSWTEGNNYSNRATHPAEKLQRITKACCSHRAMRGLVASTCTHVKSGFLPHRPRSRPLFERGCRMALVKSAAMAVAVIIGLTLAVFFWWEVAELIRRTGLSGLVEQRLALAS